MTNGATNGTLIGAAVAALVTLVPRAFDRLTGRKGDDADAAEALSTGAGAVTSAAMAMVDRLQESEAHCRLDLAAANARIDALEERITALHSAHRPPPD